MLYPKIATNLSPFSCDVDRYTPKGYKAVLPIEEIICKVASIPGLDAVELNYRNNVSEENVNSVRQILEQNRLGCANVSMNVWGEPRWKLGSLSNADSGIRREVIEFIIAGMRVAKQLNCSRVSIWPGQDGFDYPLAVNYARMIDWFVEGLQVCADAVPDVRICIEYKPKEPRAFLLFDSAARTMWMISKISRPNVGVLLDVGHAWIAHENAAQSAVLLQQEGVLDHLHFNDNYGDWDWDMIPGALRIHELIELMFWMQEIDYQGYYSIDISSPRIDPVVAVTQSVNNLRRLYQFAESLNRDFLWDQIESQNLIGGIGYVTERLISPLNAGEPNSSVAMKSLPEIKVA